MYGFSILIMQFLKLFVLIKQDNIILYLKTNFFRFFKRQKIVVFHVSQQDIKKLILPPTVRFRNKLVDIEKWLC